MRFIFMAMMVGLMIIGTSCEKETQPIVEEDLNGFDVQPKGDFGAEVDAVDRNGNIVPKADAAQNREIQEDVRVHNYKGERIIVGKTYSLGDNPEFEKYINAEKKPAYKTNPDGSRSLYDAQRVLVGTNDANTCSGYQVALGSELQGKKNSGWVQCASSYYLYPWQRIHYEYDPKGLVDGFTQYGVMKQFLYINYNDCAELYFMLTVHDITGDYRIYDIDYINGTWDNTSYHYFYAYGQEGPYGTWPPTDENAVVVYSQIQQ